MSAPGKDGQVISQKHPYDSIEINDSQLYFQAARPLGPDGKPIPGPAEVRQIQAARKMAQQQAQVRIFYFVF